MYSAELECNHLFYFKYEGIAPTDLTFCMKCQDYRYPKGWVQPKKRGRPRKIEDHVDVTKPQKAHKTPTLEPSGLPTKHYDLLPRNGPGGRSLSPSNKALALKRTYEMADEGYTLKEIAEAQGFNSTTIRNWLTTR